MENNKLSFKTWIGTRLLSKLQRVCFIIAIAEKFDKRPVICTQVYTNHKPWSFFCSLGDPTNQNWVRAEVKLDSYSSFRVGFEGIVGGDDKTDIALDDISFSAGCYVVCILILRKKRTTVKGE